VFPEIRYHYTDDSPLALLPPAAASTTGGASSSSSAPYIILDWNPVLENVGAPESETLVPTTTAGYTPEVRSISEGTMVVGVKVSPAPGVSDAVDHGHNSNMYVIDTTASTAPPNANPRTQ
jgi:hypothetical protein